MVRSSSEDQCGGDLRTWGKRVGLLSLSASLGGKLNRALQVEHGTEGHRCSGGQVRLVTRGIQGATQALHIPFLAMGSRRQCNFGLGYLARALSRDLGWIFICD